MMHPDIVAVLLVQFVALFCIADVDSAVVVVDRLQKQNEQSLSEDIQPVVASRNEDFFPLLMFLDSQWRMARSQNAREAALKKKRLAEEERMRDDIEDWDRMGRGDDSECGAECQKLKSQNGKRDTSEEKKYTSNPETEETSSAPEWKGWWNLKNQDTVENLVDSEIGSINSRVTEVSESRTSKSDVVEDTVKGEEVTTTSPSSTVTCGGGGDKCKKGGKCTGKTSGGKKSKCSNNKCREGDHRSHQGSDHQGCDHQGSHQGCDNQSHHDCDHHGHQESDQKGCDHRGGDHKGREGCGHQSHQGGDHQSPRTGDHQSPRAGDHHTHQGGDHHVHHSGDHVHQECDHVHEGCDQHGHRGDDHVHDGGDHVHHGHEHHHGSGHHHHHHHHGFDRQQFSSSDFERALEDGDDDSLIRQCLQYLGVSETNIGGMDENPLATQLCERKVHQMLAQRNKNVVIIQPEFLSPIDLREDAASQLLAVLVARNSEAQATVDDSRSTSSESTIGRHLRFARRQVVPTQQGSANYETKERVGKNSTEDVEQATTMIAKDTDETGTYKDEAATESPEQGTSLGEDSTSSSTEIRSSSDDKKENSGGEHQAREGHSTEITPEDGRKVRSQEHVGFWEKVKNFLSHFHSAESVPDSARNRQYQNLESEMISTRCKRKSNTRGYDDYDEDDEEEKEKKEEEEEKKKVEKKEEKQEEEGGKEDWIKEDWVKDEKKGDEQEEKGDWVKEEKEGDEQEEKGEEEEEEEEDEEVKETLDTGYDDGYEYEYEVGNYSETDMFEKELQGIQMRAAATCQKVELTDAEKLEGKTPPNDHLKTKGSGKGKGKSFARIIRASPITLSVVILSILAK